MNSEKANDKSHNIEIIKESIERNKYTLDLVNLWISNADNKIAMAFAILSAVLALIVFITEDLLSKIEPISINTCSMCVVKMLAIISGVLFLASVYFFILCIIPRFNKEKVYKKDYSIFYDEIKDYDNYRDYIDACNQAGNEAFNQEIEKEIYFNSCICSRKMRLFRKGIICSGLSIVFVVAAAFVYYLSVT